MNKDLIILGIESSCDETAVAITKNGELLSNVISSQIEVHKKYGGVMPEIASRLHLENIAFVLDKALNDANISLNEIDAIAFTRGPGLIGALHVGMQCAKTLSLIYNKPLIPVHHLTGHIYANEFIKPLVFPLLAIVVSGGNTELVYMKNHLDFKIIGETIDDAIGESFDKVARILGLSYPGGVEIDNRAKIGEATYKLPVPKTKNPLDFSYSGLKTAVLNLVNKEKNEGREININNLARSFEETAIKELLIRVKKATKLYEIKEIVLAGGVSANSYLREEIVKLFKNSSIIVTIPPLWATTDNAAMIAKVGEFLYKKNIFASLDIGVDPSWNIENYDKF